MSMEEADLVEIPPPMNWNSKPKPSLKRKKKVVFPEVIDVDDFEDPDLFLASGKSDTRDKDKGKGKQTVADFSPHSTTGYPQNAVRKKSSRKSSEGSHLNKAYNDIIYVDDEYMGFSDNQMYDEQYILLQSRFDELDIPPGIEVSVPWFTDDHVGTKNPFMASASTHSASKVQNNHGGMLQSSSSRYRKTEEPKASGLHIASDGGGKPQAPHEKVLHGSNNQFMVSSKKMKAPKASGLDEASVYGQNLQTPHEVLKSQFSTASSNFPKTVMPVAASYSPTLPYSATHPYSVTSPYTSLGIQNNINGAGNLPKSSGPSSSKRVYENPEVFLKKFDIFKKFDTCEDYSDHLFAKSGDVSMNPPSRSWSKKIQDEWRILEKDLPDTIFVRVYESRMDLLRFVIIGAEGTPYHDGLFFFDMFFPRTYPHAPPQVTYHSGGLRINPNLYNCGKVCLSLLNTWTGGIKEMWNPKESTVLQVLVSIQGLVLNEDPYFNEPGWAGQKGTPSGKIHSQKYNENTFIHNLKTMVYSINKPPKPFEDLVAGHFFKRAHDILAACKAYENGTQVGSFVKGGVQNVNNASSSQVQNVNKGSRLQNLMAAQMNSQGPLMAARNLLAAQMKSQSQGPLMAAAQMNSHGPLMTAQNLLAAQMNSQSQGPLMAAAQMNSYGPLITAQMNSHGPLMAAQMKVKSQGSLMASQMKSQGPLMAAQMNSHLMAAQMNSHGHTATQTNPQGLKTQLQMYMKTLVEAFAQVGVKDCDKFLS